MGHVHETHAPKRGGGLGWDSQGVIGNVRREFRFMHQRATGFVIEPVTCAAETVASLYSNP